MQFLKSKGNTQEEYYTVFSIEFFSALIIPAIATIVAMTLQNDTVICTDTTCYLHRHSWVCYAGWISLNGFMTALIGNLVMIFTRFPILYNIRTFFYNRWCTLYNYMHKPKE